MPGGSAGSASRTTIRRPSASWPRRCDRRFQTVQLPYNPTSASASRSCRSPPSSGIAVIVMRPLGKGQLLRREPEPRELEPLRDFGVETWRRRSSQVGALGRSRRRRDPRDAKPAARSREREAGTPPWFGRRSAASSSGLRRRSGIIRTMNVGVAKEIKQDEYRVALTPLVRSS